MISVDQAGSLVILTVGIEDNYYITSGGTLAVELTPEQASSLSAKLGFAVMDMDKQYVEENDGNN